MNKKFLAAAALALAVSITAGCASLRAVCERTGAGQGCGSCLSSVKMILDQHSSSREDAHATA